MEEMVMRKVFEIEQEAAGYLMGHQRTAIITSLHGSQNYWLHNDNSDIDVYTVFVPSFKDMAMGNPRENYCAKHQFDGIITFMPVSNFYQAMVNKPSLQILEIIHSTYSGFVEQFSPIIYDAERFSRINMKRVYTSTVGWGISQIQRFKKENKAKSLAYAFFAKDCVEKLLKDYPFNEIYENINDDLWELKNNPFAKNLDDYIGQVDELESYFRKKMEEKDELIFQNDNKAAKDLFEILLSICRNKVQ